MILWQRVGCLYLIMSTSRCHLKFYCVLEVEHSLICKWDSAKFGPVIRYNCLPISGSGIRYDLRVIKVYFRTCKAPQGVGETPVLGTQVLGTILGSVSPLSLFYLKGRVVGDDHTEGPK